MTDPAQAVWLAREPIRYAVAASWLGLTLVAQSDRGLCAIFMGDDPEALATDLQRRFPRAELVAAEAELGPLFALIERAAAGGMTLTEMTALFWHCLVPPAGLDRAVLGERLVAAAIEEPDPERVWQSLPGLTARGD